MGVDMVSCCDDAHYIISSQYSAVFGSMNKKSFIELDRNYKSAVKATGVVLEVEIASSN